MVHYHGHPIRDPVQGSKAFRKIRRARDKRALAAETEMPASSATPFADLSFNWWISTTFRRRGRRRQIARLTRSALSCRA
jgi:hypothetical protein